MKRNVPMRLTTRFTLCLILAGATLAATAQQPSAPTITPSAANSTAQHNWTTEQILTCTVSDCWQLAGRNETTFFEIIQQLAEISAQSRGLTFPTTLKRADAPASTSRRRRSPITVSFFMRSLTVPCGRSAPNLPRLPPTSSLKEGAGRLTSLHAPLSSVSDCGSTLYFFLWTDG